jgi:uncharacterized protein (DUF1800 family)
MSLSRRKFLATVSAAAAASALRPNAALATEIHAAPEPILGPALPPEVHVLSRLTFGAQLADFERFAGLGKSHRQRLENFLEQQLHPAKIADTDCDARLTKLDLKTLGKTLEQQWQDHVVAADALRDAAAKPNTPPDPKVPPPPKKDENTLRLQPARETEIATWVRAVFSQRQLNEQLASFWHDHFSVFAWDTRVSATFVHYDRDVIRAHMLGNFRAFLEAVAQSPSMLHYLDNELNQSGNPNENFARELFELHTLGAENYLGTMDRARVPGFGHGAPTGYVDGDVYESARAFTGWRVAADKKGANTGRFEYFEPWHDRFQKIVLGKPLKEYQPPLKDGRDVLDLVAHHPGTARYVCRKLCRRFVQDDPPPALVEKAAKVFRDNARSDDQLLKVTRAILLSEEFTAASGRKFKRPFDYVAGILRLTGAEFTPTDDFLRNYERAGQKLFSWRTPDGTPDTREKWASANSLLERWRLTNQILGGQFKNDARIGTLEGKPIGATDHLATWERRIFPAGISPGTRNAVLAYLGDKPDEARGRMAVALLFQSPEYQWR